MKRLTFAFIISSFIFVFLVIPTTHVSAASKLPKGTAIANIPVEKMTEEELRQDLTNKITIWQTGDPILLKSNFEKITIPRTAFDFDIDQTIAQIEEQTKGSFKTFFRKQKDVHIPLVTSLDTNDMATQDLHGQTHLNTDALEAELVQLAANLDEGEIALTYEDEADIPFKTVAEVDVSLDNLPEHIIERAANEIDGYIIDPETAFSYLKNLPIYSLLIDDIENTATATSVYELFLQTNFEVVERHTALHRSSQDKSDIEAYVHHAKNKDFIVHNPNDIAFVLRAERVDDGMTLRLESTFNEASFDYEVKTKKIDYRTLYRYKKDLSPGYASVIQEGEPGLDVKVEQSQYDASELLEDKKLIAHDTYLPVPRIVLTAAETESEESETNEDITLENDQNESEEIIDYYDDSDEWINDLYDDNNDYEEETQQVVGEERNKRIEELKKEYDSIIDIWNDMFGTNENEVTEKEMKQLEKEIKKYQKDIKSLEKDIQKLIENAESNKDVSLDSIMKQLDAQQEQIAFLYIIIEQLELNTEADLKKLKTTIENQQANLDTIKERLDKSDKDIEETLTNYEKELAKLIKKVDELLEKDKDNKDEEDEDAEA